MIKKLITILFMIFLAACSVNPDEPMENPTTPALNSTEPVLFPTDRLPGSQPVTNETPVIEDSYQPREDDSSLDQGSVYLDSSEILTLESYPLQFTLHLKGSLPTPCHQLRVTVQQPDAQNVIQIDVYSVVKSEQICTQVLEPFEVSVPLGSFPSGKYTVRINGEVIAEFQS